MIQTEGQKRVGWSLLTENNYRLIKKALNILVLSFMIYLFFRMFEWAQQASSSKKEMGSNIAHNIEKLLNKF